MELFKRYVAASSMGVVALVCVLVGLLGVTVLRPPTHQVSSVVSATDLIMTRGNVLSIVKDDVTVTATSKSGAPVTLSIGTTQDVKGWIGDAAYTEVIGVESDRTKLKAESHAAVSTGQTAPAAPSTPAQSGAQSGVQSGAQPLADPTSADLVTQLASSDMWFKQASGEGTVSLDLENVPSGRSALAASAAGPDDLTLTLTWKVEQTNTLAIIAFLAACVFALIALALFLTRWQLLRLRKIREARIEERRKADSLETSSINSAAVAERVAAARDSAPAPPPAEEPPEGADAPVEEPPAADEATVSNDSSTDSAEAMPVEEKAQWGAVVYTPAADESAENAPAEDEAADGASSEEEAAGEAAPSENDGATEAADSSDEAASNEAASNEVPQDDYVPDPLTDTFERRGRHGLDNGPIDQDPPERATTDTGVIDLSGIRGGRTLPSRRALREARNNGEQTVVVDGQEFNTGLIPITRPRAAEPAAPTSAPDDDASKTGGWTSIMSGWLKDRQEGK